MLDPNGRNFHRTILFEKSVYAWVVDADTSAREKNLFFSFLRSLVPGGGAGAGAGLAKQSGGQGTVVRPHRRAVCGVRNQFEILCAALEPITITPKSTVVHFTPFVSSEIRGQAEVGVLVWAISSESKASYVKALIEQAEFKRNKVEDDEDRFLPHSPFCLELGRDMHLLDLKSTSMWKAGPMTILKIGVDTGDLARLEEDDATFTPRTRTLESERQLREQLFRRTAEIEENEEILHDTRPDLSTNLFGGAGTGKTMLLIQKVACEVGPHRRILVVTRLPRLISFIKGGVRAQCGISTGVDYYTYNDLMTNLARRCHADDKHTTFSAFNQVTYDDTTGTGASATGLSFQREFVEGHLSVIELSSMSRHDIEPLTLWTAFREIKGHVNCSITKKPLEREMFMTLPKSFGLNHTQRSIAYDLYERYDAWLHQSERLLWDEADRVMYVMKFGGNVFADSEFVPWEERSFKWGEEGLVGSDGLPLMPFYHLVHVDEAQDFTSLDVALFIRMSASVRSVFLGADPAQSVELGIRMRDGALNSTFHACLPEHKKDMQVKTILQSIALKTNHRTHAQNLDLSKAIRKLLSRSFHVPGNNENALVKGPIPEALLLKKVADIASTSKFKGANVVFIAPDEALPTLRALFLKHSVKNDVMGVREAKGLEFEDVALFGFFAYFEQCGTAKEWQNVIRWLFSNTGTKTTESSEKVNSVSLEPCDYELTCPALEGQAMMLYTALTRARQHLYIIEDEESGVKQRRGAGLGDFSLRHLQQLRLVKKVQSIDAGEVEMSPQEHNARGVLLVNQAVALSNKGAETEMVQKKFEEAMDRFRPDKGCDASLLYQANKHLDAILMKRELVDELKMNFFNEKRGQYVLSAKFAKILEFEEKAANFVQRCIDDPFVIDEARQLAVLMEEAFFGTPYWVHFSEICSRIKEATS